MRQVGCAVGSELGMTSGLLRKIGSEESPHFSTKIRIDKRHPKNKGGISAKSEGHVHSIIGVPQHRTEG